MPRFKKVEIIILGAFAPLSLSIYTIYLLLQSKAIFWGRNTSVIYYGVEAYWVSCLWFGLSGLMVGHFLCRSLHFLKPKQQQAFMFGATLLIFMGLAGAIIAI